MKGFDIWQYNTSTNEDVWLDLPVVDMKLLSKVKVENQVVVEL